MLTRQRYNGHAAANYSSLSFQLFKHQNRYVTTKLDYIGTKLLQNRCFDNLHLENNNKSFYTLVPL